MKTLSQPKMAISFAQHPHLLKQTILWQFLSLVLLLHTHTILANQAYVGAKGRISRVNLPDGQRQVATGWNLPASGFLSVQPTTGDLYTADQDDRAIYRVNRITGLITTVSGPGLGIGPALSSHLFGIAIEGSGSVVVVDGAGGLSGVVRINPNNGNRTVLSAGVNSSSPTGSGTSFQSPLGITIESTGNLLVTDFLRNAVIRVDAVSGNRTLVSGDPFGDNVGTGPDLKNPKGILVKPDGTIVVSDSGGTTYTERLIQINATNGNRTVLFASSSTNSTQGSFIYGISLGTNGSVIAPFQQLVNSVPQGGTLWGIDPVTGGVTNISGSINILFGTSRGTGPTFLNPIDVKPDHTGLLLVSDVLIRSLFVVDQVTGNRSILPNSRTGGGLELYASKGIAVGTNSMLAIADEGDSTSNIFGAVTNRQPVLLQMNPATGDRSIISAGSNTSAPRGSGSNFDRPNGVATEATGTFVLADSGSSNPKVLRIDPVSGNRTIIASSSQGNGTNFVSPYGIAVEQSGSLLVSDLGLNAVLRIDPATGNRTVLSSATQGSGTMLLSIKGIALLEDGTLAVADAGRSALFRVDTITGNRTIISSVSQGAGTNFVSPCGVVVEGNGKVLVVDSSTASLIRVDLATGNRVVVANPASGAGPLFESSPEFVALKVNPQVVLTAPQCQTNGAVQFSFAGTPGTAYIIQTSTNLVDWTALTNIQSGGLMNQITDPNTAGQTERFYRAVFTP